MSHELITSDLKSKPGPVEGHLPVGKIWRHILLSAVLTVSFVAAAFAKGGDYVAPYPVSDPLPAKQEARAMAVDSSGNILVAGYTNVSGMNNDYRLVKFWADGSGVAWRASFDKNGGDDQATAVVIDGNNDIIVTGTVWNIASTDIHTIKYSGVDGSVLWEHTWSGAAGGIDAATSIAVDATNNIYVAGYSVNGAGNDDYLILKYPSAGSTPTWQEIWNSGYNSNDRIAAIAAGADGIAVTGASSKIGTDFDILTRKYGFDKTLLWEQRRASAGNGDDRGTAVRIDAAGNVAIGGYIANGANNDMIVIKYAAAAPGGTVWEKIYNGGNNDEVQALWIDGIGDIYVTGHTYTYSGNEDFYTVRYGSADGIKLWSAVYDSGNDFTDVPVGIVVREGADGDVFVSGYTATSSNENFTILKYKKGSGELVWQQSFNGAGDKNERPVGMFLDGAGEACVAGWSETAANSYDFLAIKYDFGRLDSPTGLTATTTSNTTIDLSWRDNSANESNFKIERKLGESGTYAEIATIAANLTTYTDTGLVSNSYYYYRVQAYNAAEGNSNSSNEAHALTKVVSYEAPAWVYQYNGADNREDEAVAIVTGIDGHPVVTGFTDLTEEGVAGSYSFDYLTVKLDRADKSLVWKARYDSGDGGTDMAAGVAIDNNGDAVVTGTAYLSGGSDKSDDLYTIKFSTAGYTDPNSNPPMEWGAQYGTQSGIDQATAVQTAKDTANNVVVIGHGINTANDEDMFIIKYLPDGTTPWTPIVYDGPAHGNDYPSAVAIDTAGNILVTGSTENAAGDFDIYTAKYNGATGALIWSQLYAGGGNGDDHGLSLALDGSGDVYITGYGVNAVGNEEWVTIKYDGADSSAQREIWKSVHNGPAAPVNGNDRGIAVGIDPIDGDIVVAGTSYLTATDSDFHLIRYSSANGTVIWERNFDRHDIYDYVTAMAVDSSGYIYVTGNSRSGLDSDPAFDGSSEILSLIYDFEGTFLGASVYDGGRQDEARSIAVNEQGEAFAAGLTYNALNPDYLVLKQKNNYILVPAPFALVPQADYGRINITWQANTPGSQFRVERTVAPVLPTSSWDAVTTAAAGTTSFLDSGLAAGTAYCYRIYAFSGALNSRTIGQCTTTTLAPPALGQPVVDSTSQITLSWSQVPGNSGYKIERRTGAGAWNDLAVKGADVTGHTDIGLTPGTTYYYRISTNSASGYSLPGNELGSITMPLAPTLAAPTGITNTQMVLGWNTVTGASGYTLQYRLAGGSYADFAGCTNIGATSCTVTGLTAPNNYNFQVKASNNGGDSVWSNEQSGVAALAVPTWPVSPATPSAVTNNGMTVTWVNPVISGAGTITYTLQHRLASGAYVDETTPSACAGTTALSCNITGLTANRSYNFRVKATNAAGNSLWSSELAGNTLLDTPTLNSATGGAAEVSLAWTAVPEASSYTVQIADCKNSASNPGSCDGSTAVNYNAWGNLNLGSAVTTYTVTSLASGSNYRFKVFASVSGNTSAASNVLHTWTNLSSPTVTITPASSTALNLSWNQFPGETNYTVEVSTTGSGGAYSAIPAATGLAANTASFAHTGLALDTQYCYKVKAYSTVINHPADVYSLPQCMTTPPDAPVVTIATNDLESSFSVVEDGTRYWNQADYFINQPVVITSGGNTYTKRIAGSVNSALFVSPAFTSETINQGDSYTILQTVTGKATGNAPGSPANSLLDADKNWGMNEWIGLNGFKIKILNSVNANNVGDERTLAGANGTIDVYVSANFDTPIIAGDTYQIASFFGAASANGFTTQLTQTGNVWGAANWAGYYLLMTSGSNNGHARRIISNTTTILTTDPFPNSSATGDTYLIAPVARVAPYFGTAAGTGSTTTTLLDTGHVWQTNYTGYYLQMTSGSNLGKARLITANDNTAKTITVTPAFDSAIVAGDTYTIIPAVQFAAYFGTAAGSPGSSPSELTDTGNSWLTDWSQGYFLMMTSGANSGQMRTISAKTATTLTVSTPFANPISSTDTYLIGASSATSGSGKLTTAITPAATAKGTAKLTLASGSAELYSAAPGYGNNYNYELLSLKDLTPLAGNFDAKFDYTIMSGLISPDTSLPYLYLSSTYASFRHDFQSPAGKAYNVTIQRGRVTPLDNGRTTASAASLATLYDTRTMAGSSVRWKSWGVDQWKDYYLQMTSGPNNQLVRKISGNTADSITLENPFPYDAAATSGTAAVSGNSSTKLVDAAATNWTVNQWQNYYLHLASGANAGQTLKIISSDASSVTVGGTGFTSPIGSGDAYRIFTTSGEAYRINVIAGTAAIHGSTQNGTHSTNALLIDSSANTGTTLPPKNWGTNQWQGFYLYMASGPNIGQFRTIAANTANTIAVDPPFPYQIASSDSYNIFDPRAAAQAQEAFWLSIYEPITAVTEQLIIPTTDTAGKLRLAKTGNSLQFYTAPSSGAWQQRRQLDLQAGDLYTPSLFWVYQLGRLPHLTGTNVRTKVENFAFTVPASNPATFSSTYWSPEVGHIFRRSSLKGSAIEVAWDKIGTAVLYEVERCPSTDPNNPALHTVGTCTTFIQNQPVDSSVRLVSSPATTGLMAGYTYRFRVRAKYNANDYTAWSSEQWVTVTPPAPIMVAPTVATTTTTQLTPTWNNVSGDNGYKLFWKVRSGATCSDDSWNGPIVRSINVTSYNHAGLTPGTFYCYKIAAIGPSGPPVTPDSLYSNIVSQSTKPSAPGVITFSGITSSSVTLSWPQVSGNSGYQIDRSLNNSNWTNNVGTVGQDVTTFTNSGLATGTLYYYRVSANSSGGFSAPSTVQSTTTSPAAPSITTSVASASRIDISWPLVVGASNYKIERKEAGGSYSEISNVAMPYAQDYCGYSYPTVACPTASPAITTYQNVGLPEDTTYCFQLKSWNSSGGDSLYSAEKCATTLPIAEQTLTATPLNSFRIRLDWVQTVCTPNPCDPPEGYEIERMVRDGNWVKIATVGATVNTFTDSIAIDPIKQYRYRVRSFSGTRKTPYAEAVTYTPPYTPGDNVGP